MMFHVGQKVVCVDDRLCVVTGDPTGLRKGAVYTVRGLTSDGEGLFVEELYREWVPGIEFSLWYWRFRPVRETSIEVFQSLLNPSPEDIERLREKQEEYVEW